MLGGDVVGEVRERDEAGGRGDVDDRAAAARDHVRQDGLRAPPRPVQVDVDHRRPRVLVELVGGRPGGPTRPALLTSTSTGPSSSWQRSTAASICAWSRTSTRGRRHGCRARGIGARSPRARSRGAERIRAPSIGAQMSREQQVCARLGERQRGRAADAARRAGDEDGPRHSRYRSQPKSMPSELVEALVVRPEVVGELLARRPAPIASYRARAGAAASAYSCAGELEEVVHARRAPAAGALGELLERHEEELLAREELAASARAARRSGCASGTTSSRSASCCSADRDNARSRSGASRASSAATASAKDSSGSSPSRRDIWNCEYARSTGLRSATISFASGRASRDPLAAPSRGRCRTGSPRRSGTAARARARSAHARARSGKCVRYQSTPRKKL